MTFLDFIIIIYLGISLWDGWRRGFFQGLANLLGFVLGFTIGLFGSHFFADSIIVPIFHISDVLAEIIAFILIISAVAVLFSVLGSYLIRHYEKPTMKRLIKFDEIAGSLLGFFTSLVSIGALLLILSILPQEYGFGPILQQSKLSPPIIKTISSIYDKLEAAIAPRLPQLIKFSEQFASPGEQQQFFNRYSEKEWQELDGALCYNCGGHIKYQGLKTHLVSGEEVISPYFVCEKCGRHSDSCQSFEGYHKLYGECPALLGKQGYRFDCGMWPNGNFVKPKGKCPVDGNVAEYSNWVEAIILDLSFEVSYGYFK